MLGAHFSIAGGLHRAVYEAQKHGCDTLQIFTKNANTWKERELKEKEIELFDKARRETNITSIASHTSYLINLASPEEKKRKMSADALAREMTRSSDLGISSVVLHPGSHMNRGDKEGQRRIAGCINRIFNEQPDVSSRLLLETTAGQGSSLGHSFEQLAAILEQVTAVDNMGVCLDTAHVFAAGYDIRNREGYQRTMERFDRIIGLKHLHLLHLNDSKKDLGSHVDRHEHIGRGKIGLKGFRLIMKDRRFKHIPKIIETPKGERHSTLDSANLERLRRMV